MRAYRAIASNIRTNNLTILLACLSTLLVGCPSSSSGEDSENNLNRGLTGRIVTSNGDRPFEFDLATGQSRFLDVTQLDELLESVPESQRPRPDYFTGTADSGFVLSGNKCFLRDFDNNGSTLDGCYSLFNSQLEQLAFIRTRDVEMEGPVKLSRSGNFLAFSSDDVPVELISEVRIIDARTQATLRTYPSDEPLGLGSFSSPALAWGLNDELFFSEASEDGLRINITNPTTLEIANTIALPNVFETRVRSLDVSPDGSKLAMEVDNQIVVLDLSRLELTLLAAATFGDLDSPRWSPNGEMLMFVHETSTPAPVLDVTFQATVFPSSISAYAISATGDELVVIGGGTLEGAILIQSILPDSDGQLSTFFPGDAALDIPYFDWLP